MKEFTLESGIRQNSIPNLMLCALFWLMVPLFTIINTLYVFNKDLSCGQLSLCVGFYARQVALEAPGKDIFTLKQNIIIEFAEKDTL